VGVQGGANLVGELVLAGILRCPSCSDVEV